MKVEVDLALCVGHARCQAVAEGVYGTDTIEGKVVLIAQPDSPEMQGLALRGARACPERAIRVRDATNTQIWPPPRLRV
jgi:ferredoxin